MHIRAATLALRLKHGAFHSEQEWRLVLMPMRTSDKDGKPLVRHRIAKSGALVPYLPMLLTKGKQLDLEGIRIGPAHDEFMALRGLQSIFTSLEYPDPERLALKSKIPFRS